MSVRGSRSPVPALVAGWAVFTLMNAQRIAVVPFFNEFRRAFGTDYTAAGGLLSAYLLGYVVAQIPAGLAADNLPTPSVTAVGLAMLTLTSSWFAVADRLAPALLLRVLMGVSAAALYSSTVKLTLSGSARRGTAMGLLQSGAGTGMVVGLFAMPLLAQATSIRTRPGVERWPGCRRLRHHTRPRPAAAGSVCRSEPPRSSGRPFHAGPRRKPEVVP